MQRTVAKFCMRMRAVYGQDLSWSYVDGGHHSEENELFKTLHFKVCSDKQQQQGDAHVGRSVGKAVAKHQQPAYTAWSTGTDGTGSCCSATAARLAIASTRLGCSGWWQWGRTSPDSSHSLTVLSTDESGDSRRQSAKK